MNLTTNPKQMNPSNNFASALTRNGTIMVGFVLIGLAIISTIISPYFLSLYNLQSLMRDIALIGFIAMGQALLLLIAELDLSVGAMATLAGIFGGLMMTSLGLNPVLAFVLGLLSGAGFGAINGLLVTRLKISSMVTTIGMTGLYTGITLLITKGQAITQIPDSILFLGKGAVGGIPIPFIIMLIVMFVVLVFVTKTKTGRYIYAIGNSKQAAVILGIKVDRIRVMMFTITGFLSALAGMLSLARLGSAQASIGTNWPLNSIAACVIGGILLTGGVGSPAGAIIGTAILAIISNIIVMAGVDIYAQSAVSGVVVVAAISLPSILRILRERKKTKGLRNIQ